MKSTPACAPGGNWGSYPPHKHDETRANETELEEIYYYVVADGPTGPGLAYQHVYGTTERPIDLLTTVRTDDTVLVPHGWHGPTMAAPGYDLESVSSAASFAFASASCTSRESVRTRRP